MTPRQQRRQQVALAASLRGIWDRASDVLEEVEAGRASFADLAAALEDVCEDAAAGLADIATAMTSG